MTHGPEAKMETRAVAGASSLTRDRESNVLAASGREAAALLECVRAIARFLVIAQHEGLPDEPGFLFARSGPLGGKLFFRIENGTRQVLCGTQAR